MLATRGHPALVLQGAMSTTNRRAVVDRLDTANAGDGLLVIGTTPFIGEGFDAPALDTLPVTRIRRRPPWRATCCRATST